MCSVIEIIIKNKINILFFIILDVDTTFYDNINVIFKFEKWLKLLNLSEKSNFIFDNSQIKQT